MTIWQIAETIVAARWGRVLLHADFTLENQARVALIERGSHCRKRS